MFVKGREGMLEVENGNAFGDEIQEQGCLSANSDDLSTFLQLSSELCRKSRGCCNGSKP